MRDRTRPLCAAGHRRRHSIADHSHRSQRDMKTTSAASNSSSTDEEDAYDGTGAALFIISVVIVYGLGVVVILLLALTRRRRKFSGYDEQVNIYLRDRPEIQRQARLDRIFLAEYTLRKVVVHESAQGVEDQSSTSPPKPLLSRRFSIPVPHSNRFSKRQSTGENSVNSTSL